MLDRREFLGLGVAGLTAVALQGRMSARDRPDSGAAGRIVVVGAGLAGLTAAHDLRDAGWDVVVLEARDRVGGRVRTERAAFSGGMHAEVGGESIDDNHRAIQALLGRFGLRTVPRPPDRETRATTFIRGRRAQAAEYVTARGGTVLADYDRYYDAVDRLGDGVDPARPEAARHAERLDGRSLADFIAGLHLVPEARTLVEIAETSEYATEPANLSLLFVAQQSAVVRDVPDTAVETMRIDGGNDGLPTAMAAALGRALQLGTEVTAVEARRDGVTVRTRGGGDVDAAHVVIALPPGPLRHVRFRPALPAPYRAVIDRLDLGPAVKVMTEYPDRFWTRGDASGLVISDLPFHVAWDATDSVPSQAGVLTTFTTGRAAARLSARRDPDRIATVRRQIELVYPEARGVAGGAATHAWRNDRFTGGGYAFWRPGEFMDAWPVLRRPAGRVHFAGEHTAALAGYMESAVRSGHRVAGALGPPPRWARRGEQCPFDHRLGCAAMAEIRAEITANVWQVVVDEGQLIAEGDEICILESMKMEIPVITETPGVVRELHVVPEQVVHEGDLIAVIDES